MRYFTEQELTDSNVAKRLGIWNWPNEQYIFDNLNALVDNILDPAREKLGAPILVNSGWRCNELNIAVGGTKNSQHKTGNACDITCSNLNKLWNILKTLEVDQCILYKKKNFIHVSYVTHRKNRNQYIINN